jgi:hypothetical protein
VLSGHQFGVMAGLVPAIHVFVLLQDCKDVDARDGAPRALARGDPDERGHDGDVGGFVLT